MFVVSFRHSGMDAMYAAGVVVRSKIEPFNHSRSFSKLESATSYALEQKRKGNVASGLRIEEFKTVAKYALSEDAERFEKYDEEEPETPGWPEGLEAGKAYRVACDDKGRAGGSWFQLFVDEQGDVYLAMQDWENIPKGEPNPIPGIRIRTWAGGGRNTRTRAAMVQLANAIRLDNLEQEQRAKVFAEKIPLT